MRSLATAGYHRGRDHLVQACPKRRQPLPHRISWPMNLSCGSPIAAVETQAVRGTAESSANSLALSYHLLQSIANDGSWGHGDGSTLPERALGPTPFGAIYRTALQQEALQGGIRSRGIAETQVPRFTAVWYVQQSDECIGCHNCILEGASDSGCAERIESSQRIPERKPAWSDGAINELRSGGEHDRAAQVVGHRY